MAFEQAKQTHRSFRGGRALLFLLLLGFPLAPLFSLSTTIADALFGQGSALLGSPYRLGGRHEDGLDCSGLVWAVYHRLIPNLPTSAWDQARWGHKVPLTQLQPGDLIFFATERRGEVSHVALYLGNDTLLHAVSEGWPRGVVLSSLSEHYWKTRALFARRLSWPPGTVWETPGKIYRVPYVKGWYQGPLLDGQPDGKGFMFFRNGDTFVGRFRQGKPEGYGVYHWRDGAWYQGQFKAGVRTGEGTYQPRHGALVHAFWVDDQPQKVEEASISLWPTSHPVASKPKKLLPVTQFVTTFVPEAVYPRRLPGTE